MSVKPPRRRLPPLNALRAFEAAARLESFAKAAEELGVTAGAVTQQIRQLEAALGMTLFRRLPQGVTPTEPARTALPRLTRGFDTLAQAVETLREGHADRALTIAALPCLAQLWISPRLPGLHRAFPELQISVSAMEQPPEPRREPHDLALFYLGEGDTRGGVQAATPDTIRPVCAPGLAQDIATPADLSRKVLLHDAVWRQDWARWLGFAGAPAEVDAGRGPAFSLYSLAVDAALAGSGVLMGRASLVAPHLADGRLVAPFAAALPTRDRLTIFPGRAEGGHPRREEVAAWLMASA